MSTSADTASRGSGAVTSASAARRWKVTPAAVRRRPVLRLERDGVRRIVRVSAKERETWETSTRYAVKEALPESVGRFWVFVDVGKGQPAFYIVPEDWMVEDILVHHSRYLAKHGDARPCSPKSAHHKIAEARIERWRDRWDLLDDDERP